MPCYAPLPAYRNPAGGVSMGYMPWQVQRDHLELEELRLPCGSCVGCQMSRGREWAIRCALEARSYPESVWGTLTYNEKYLPPTLSKRHLSLFMKRLRSKLEPRRFRFFASGEYGEL